MPILTFIAHISLFNKLLYLLVSNWSFFFGLVFIRKYKTISVEIWARFNVY